MLNNKKILITGGTGTVGLSLIRHILDNYTPKVIRIYSRDETKQSYLKNMFSDITHKLRLFIGDIRDKDRLIRAIKDVDIVFHLAALKHVGVCEYNPFEAIKTNIIGIQNVIEVCIDSQVEKFIYSSSDKAATPCNTMGVTKLLGEKLVSAANYYKGTPKPIFYSVRFGNVVGSRGSLVPLIEEQVKKNLPISLTHKEMTRYLINPKSAIEFMLKTLEFAQGGEVFVPKMDAVKITDLIDVLVNIFAERYKKEADRIQINEVGMFVGEKLYEELISIEEADRTYEIDDMYVIIPQLTEVYQKLDLNKYSNVKKFDKNKPFNSKEAPLLTKEEIKNFLIKNSII